jgi:7-cyano-7-deazaguanine synthase in queuosine biosynthesis
MDPTRSKLVVQLSGGGIDSTAVTILEHPDVLIHFDYQHTAYRGERNAVSKLVAVMSDNAISKTIANSKASPESRKQAVFPKYYRPSDSSIKASSGPSLLFGNGDDAFVSGRNATLIMRTVDFILSTLLPHHARRATDVEILLGFCDEGFDVMPDADAAFISAINEVIDASYNSPTNPVNIKVVAPYSTTLKQDMVNRAIKEGLERKILKTAEDFFYYSFSCWNPTGAYGISPAPCGKCRHCAAAERVKDAALTKFAPAKAIDPMTALTASLERYRAKKVAVIYSSGYDSTFLAYTLATEYKADVTLFLLDDGVPEAGGIEVASSLDQFEPYAVSLCAAAAKANFKNPRREYSAGSLDYKVIRTVNTNQLYVAPSNLKPAVNADALHHEEAGDLAFISGFMLNVMTESLSVAAADGFDYLLTGHMKWNQGFYADEAPSICTAIMNVFKAYYGDRLVKIPVLEMPFTMAGVDIGKEHLIQFNETVIRSPLPPASSFSCGDAAVDENYELLFVNNITSRNGSPNRIMVACEKCAHCIDRARAFKVSGYQDHQAFKTQKKV